MSKDKSKEPIIPTCHPDRKHSSGGLCHSCYNVASKRRTRKLPLTDDTRATCHPERRRKAKGLCDSCYDKKRKLEQPSTAPKAKCHPDRMHASKGLCHECYNKSDHTKKRRNDNRRVFGKPLGTRSPARKNRLMETHGIDEAMFDSMFSAQNGLCAICNINAAKAVDHDHKTGHVRGLVCGNCNFALGHVRDDVNIIQSCINYLIHHNEEKEERTDAPVVSP